MLSWLLWTLIDLAIIALVLYYGGIFLARALRGFGYSAEAAKIEAFLEKLTG